MTPFMTSPWWSSWSESVWRASWQGALCALAVWLLARAVPRLPAALRAGLWWLVALKFVLTLGWPKPMPLALLPVESTAAQSQTVRVEGTQSQTQGQTVMVLMAPDATVSMRVPAQGQTPAHAEALSTGARVTAFFKGAVASLRAHPWTVGAVWALLVLWGAGVALKVRGHVLAWRQVRGMRDRARPLRHPVLEEEAEFLANEAGLRRPPTLLVSDEVVSPLAAGLVSPVIVLPAKALRDLPEDSLRMALAHEIAHLRRGDLWLGWVPALAETVLFFHPLARQAAREYALAREEACDAEALRLTGAEPADYGELLIAFGITRPPGSAAALGASAHLHALHRRLRMLEHVDVVPTQPRRWLKGALFALGAVVLMPFQVVAKAPAESTAPAAKDAAPAPVKVGTVRHLPEDAAPASNAKPSPASKPTVMEHTAKAPGTPADAPPLPALPPLPPPTPGKSTTRMVTTHVPPTAPAPIPDGDTRAPVPPAPPMPPVGGRPVPPVPPVPPVRGALSPVAPMAPMLAAAPRPPAPPAPPPDMGIEDGDSFAYLSEGRSLVMAGSTDDLYLARTFKQQGKDLLFVRRDNKPMLIRDAKTLEQVRKLLEDDRKLGDAQGSLGEKQAALGAQQAALGQKQAELGYPMSQIAAKHAAIAAKRAEIAMERARLHSLADGPERDRKEAELDKRDDSFDAELEGLDKQQEELSEKMQALGEEQRKLGEQQAKLGGEQAKLGHQQAAQNRESMKKVMAVIDEAIRKGLAEPLPT
ncbi:peptidase m56 family protein [Corallococcus coralloides DSM 2259]|uniref:Peptidase m56 family protein n=1 Tax=Corallococcus coralloides (strain ATCC 25202 / DSM 2259 / NBRC 100086 / M2) TaxID=1144275 RepID=H8MLA5_CORCM|nr:M56 family metallopeptidase [Corallococcus coralloides]AFE07476.1 peptidase m56 family protein [Corallococcus coralloides DSM 2259]